MANDAGITAAQLRAILHYDPLTGIFKRIVPTKGCSKSANQNCAGSLKPSGYVCINISGVRYRLHRLAWLYMTGEHPTAQVDHINGNRSDNRWGNLRLATNQQNQANAKKPKNNTSGYKGVYWSKQHRKWVAKLNFGKQQIYLGFYKNPKDAHGAYVAAAKSYFGEFARSG